MSDGRVMNRRVAAASQLVAGDACVDWWRQTANRESIKGWFALPTTARGQSSTLIASPCRSRAAPRALTSGRRANMGERSGRGREEGRKGEREAPREGKLTPESQMTWVIYLATSASTRTNTLPLCFLNSQ